MMWYLQLAVYSNRHQEEHDWKLEQIPLGITEFGEKARAEEQAERMKTEELAHMSHRIRKTGYQLAWVEENKNFPRHKEEKWWNAHF